MKKKESKARINEKYAWDIIISIFVKMRKRNLLKKYKNIFLAKSLKI